jgi:hypothetical protein
MTAFTHEWLPNAIDDVLVSCDQSGKVTFNWPLIAKYAQHDPMSHHVNVAVFIAAAVEEAALLIDQTWHKTPAEYAEAIRALVKPPA